MALYALDDVDDAYHVTRAFLTSIDRTTWLKLALIVFFVGGVGANFPGANFSTGDVGMDPGASPVDEVPPFDLGTDFWLLVAGLVVVGVGIALALTFVAAVMEFVFVESLRTEVVSIREYWGRYWRKGVHLFVFRLVAGLLFLAPFLVILGLFFAPIALGGGFGAPLAMLLVLLPVIFVLAVVVGLIDGFTTNFVVPIMILEDRGVLDGWRRLWPTVRTQWKQYLAYAVASWILSIVGGILIAVVAGILIAVLFVPFGILAAVGIGLLSVLEPVGIAWLVVTGILFALAALVVWLLVTVPVQTYLRYYALLILGDVDADLDVIPEQRAAARSDVEEPS